MLLLEPVLSARSRRRHVRLWYVGRRDDARRARRFRATAPRQGKRPRCACCRV